MPVEIRQPGPENTQVHRRKSSKDGDDDSDGLDHPAPPSTTSNGKTPTLLERRRVGSLPASSHSLLRPPPRLPAVHTRISLSNRAPPNGSSSPSSPLPYPLPHSHSHSHSHSFSHQRTRSTSTPLSPPLLSPSAPSFPFPASHTAPQLTSQNPNGLLYPTPNRRHHHHHHRIHSRNLSVFFPRPDSLPHAIQEDGAQETETASPPMLSIPTAGSSVSITPSAQLGAGFTFGGRPPSSAADPSLPLKLSGGSSRRGHHHKHSLSHNFFSFLEPGSQTSTSTLDSSELHTQPTPVPVSPWAPTSSYPQSTSSDKSASSPLEQPTNTVQKHPNHHATRRSSLSTVQLIAHACAIGQFVLGACLWVAGQHIASLGCTGLGYWVVFDAMGIAVTSIFPRWFAVSGTDRKAPPRRFYGTKRVKTVLMFAQAVYLMFAAVYVSKEAVENFLLNAGKGIQHEKHAGGVHAGTEGHHHHHHPIVEPGLDIPFRLISLALCSVIGTALVYGNHSDLADIANNRLSSFRSLVRSILLPSRSSRSSYVPLASDGVSESTRATDLLSNPFIVSPVSFCLVILGIRFFIQPAYHRISDLLLACLEAVVMFRLAYRLCFVLGAVLLQTSPPRGESGGRMEAFLRVMKEVERHPKVLHLPPPHIWQVTPSARSHSKSSAAAKKKRGDDDDDSRSPSLVVTLELHVQSDLDDAEVIKLTRWTWERCVMALGATRREDGRLEDGEVDVTVGVVRG